MDATPTFPRTAARAVPAKPPHARLEYLDAIRGLAAVAVVCCHFISAYGIPYNPRVLSGTPLRFWWDGAAAVSLFFVLSGLVLSLRHFRTSDRPALDGFSYGGYVVARACRIGLPYAAMLLASAGLWRFAAQDAPGAPAASPWFHARWAAAPTVSGVLHESQLYLTANDYRLVPQAWSLSIELVLSLLVPAAVLVAGRHVGWVLLAAVVLATLGQSPIYVVHFALGVALAKHFRATVARLEPRPVLRLGLAAAGLFAYGYRYFRADLGRLHPGDTDWYVPAVGAAVLLAVCSASPLLRRALAHRAVHHLGRVSYSLYLCHLAVLICLTPRVMAAAARCGVSHWVGEWAVGLAFTLLASVAVADPMYRFVEVPTVALGRRLSDLAAGLERRVAA